MSKKVEDVIATKAKAALRFIEGKQYRKALLMADELVRIILVTPHLSEKQKITFLQTLLSLKKSLLRQTKQKVSPKADGTHSQKPPPRQPIGETLEGATDSDMPFEIIRGSEIALSDLVGVDSVVRTLWINVVGPFKYPDLYSAYDLPMKVGFLLYGPPGVGKTSLAKAIAAELDVTFMYVSAAHLMSKWVGESEKNAKLIFAKAKELSPTILFFDEADALFGRSKSSVLPRIQAQLKAEMEGVLTTRKHSIIFLAATNVPWVIDEAYLRPGRFDRLFYIPLPDKEARKKLFQKKLESRPAVGLTEDKLDRLAEITAGYSGADIEAIVNEASLQALLETLEDMEAVESKVETVRPLTYGLLESLARNRKPSVSKTYLNKLEAFAREHGG